MKFRLALAVLSLLTAFGAFAEMTNDLSDAEIQGRQFAQQLLEQRPATNFVQTGNFNIRNDKGILKIPIRFQTFVTPTIWSTTYETISESNHVSLVVIHEVGKANQYEFYNGSALALALPKLLAGNDTMIPFANSDFWICDLGLEFFHWPEQKILKHDMKRGRSCEVLESTNPSPSTNGYSRVVSWIDNETLGIIHAEAYDAKGTLLKESDPKSFKKVNGQWELQEMEIRNDQTGSRTRLEFDVKKE
jgi:hypothetical protein